MSNRKHRHVGFVCCLFVCFVVCLFVPRCSSKLHHLWSWQNRPLFVYLIKKVHPAGRGREALQRKTASILRRMMDHLSSSGVKTFLQDRMSFRADPISDHSWGCSSDTLATSSWVVRDCLHSQVLTRCAEYLDATPWQFVQLHLEGIIQQTRLCFNVYACVRSFHDWLSRGGRTRCARRFPQIWFPRFVNPFANYCCLTALPHLPPPCCSLKVLFWGNHSQMENIRRNRFHLPVLLLSLRGDTPFPSDISSRWTITESSSITFYDDSWHPKCRRNRYNEQRTAFTWAPQGGHQSWHVHITWNGLSETNFQNEL